MRSVFAHVLRRAFARSAENFQPGRRAFLRKSALAGATLMLPLQGCFDHKKSVAIIGAGIAGLTTAYELKKNNIASVIYEAQGRAGGRILTVNDAVVDGAYVDFGGEYIDLTHTDLLSLSKELGVEITDLQPDKLAAHYYFFQGRKITEEELVEALQPFAARLTQDIDSIPDELHYSKGDQYQRLDNLSVTDYLNEIGVKGWLYDFFDMVMTGEYGMEASQQTAINLIYVLALPIKVGRPYEVLGIEHEVYKFKGGSQQLIAKLQAQVQDQVKTGWRLTKLYKNKNDYSLTFEVNGKTETIEADVVVLTLPFTVLRQIELNFEFPERKKKCIAELGFGISAKTAMGFKKRVWREQGYQGYTYTDINRTTIWDSSQGVDIPEGSLSFVTGGKESIDFQNLDYAAIKERWLGGAEKLFPGLTEQYNGRIAKFCWAANPFSKGSYTSYTKGQASAFAGVESEPFENIFFAGEHCSILHQGFMNGAVESALKASRLIQKIMTT
ncbi:MAG: FAD-dependent oxidoreductase [Bacteroidetes bacterium]|nr:FAD-dependent oxidoreductase [Bacteroidota bacterium]MBS1540294.1 FAD-dependent oxidoreductase [Bacteroidota bacterium]